MKRLIMTLVLCVTAISSYGQRLIVRMDDMGVTHATNLAISLCP